jgi:hypothetical protein
VAPPFSRCVTFSGEFLEGIGKDKPLPACGAHRCKAAAVHQLSDPSG